MELEYVSEYVYSVYSSQWDQVLAIFCDITNVILLSFWKSIAPLSLFSNLHYMIETRSDMNYIIRKRF